MGAGLGISISQNIPKVGFQLASIGLCIFQKECLSKCHLDNHSAKSYRSKLEFHFGDILAYTDTETSSHIYRPRDG